MLGRLSMRSSVLNGCLLALSPEIFIFPISYVYPVLEFSQDIVSLCFTRFQITIKGLASLSLQTSLWSAFQVFKFSSSSMMFDNQFVVSLAFRLILSICLFQVLRSLLKVLLCLIPAQVGVVQARNSFAALFLCILFMCFDHISVVKSFKVHTLQYFYSPYFLISTFFIETLTKQSILSPKGSQTSIVLLLILLLLNSFVITQQTKIQKLSEEQGEGNMPMRIKYSCCSQCHQQHFNQQKPSLQNIAKFHIICKPPQPLNSYNFQRGGEPRMRFCSIIKTIHYFSQMTPLFNLLNKSEYYNHLMIKVEQNDDVPQTQEQKVTQDRSKEMQQKSEERNTLKIIRKHYDRWHTKAGCKWSLSQNRQYLKFLLSSSHLFNLPLQEKKRIKVNVLLSKRIPSRTSTQCHSHHQKMVLKYGTIEKVIEELSKVFTVPASAKKNLKNVNKEKEQQPKKEQKERPQESTEQKLAEVKTEEVEVMQQRLIKEDQNVDYIYFSTPQ